MKINKETHPELLELLIKGDPRRVDIEHRRGETFFCRLYQNIDKHSVEYFKNALGDKWSDDYLGQWISNNGTYSDSWGLTTGVFYEFYPCEVEEIIIKDYKYKAIKDEA